jgi:hypothetical protein
MNITKFAIACTLGAAALAGPWGQAHAASVTLFGDRSVFITALGGAPTVSQDFEGYVAGTNLVGVNVLPQVSLSTNLSSLAVLNSAGLGNLAFASTRNQPEAVYNINFSGSTTAFGFDIAGFDPATPGPGFLSFYFADGDLTYTLIPVIPTNATELVSLFFGVISDIPLVRITWSEGPELDGFSCCEETGLDNMIMRGSATSVPEPSTWAMTLLGLAGAGWQSRRRRVL